MGEKKFITGNTAVAHAVRLSGVGVIAVYPITPQTPIAETLATFVGSGQLDAEYIRVESEHSALAACLGGCMAGVRSFTATASHGLAYMHEMLTYVAGGRFPIVLAIAGRSIGPPWSIWGEQQDSIQQRDTGCIQIYVETAQEAFDTILQAFKIAENPRVFTPVLVCLDGFHVSHAQELVEVSTLDEVRKFLPPFNTSVTLDPDEPMSLAIGASGKQYATWRFEQYQALEAARTVIEEVDREFGEVFGRSYGGLVDAYRCDQAELIIVIMGSFAGMARDVVDSMRSKGVKAGLLRLRAFRPFPSEAVRNYLSSTRNVIVIDRDFSYGNEGAVCTEVRAAIFNLSSPPTILNFIGGLGGADITAEEIESLAEKFMRKGIEGDHKVVFQFMGGDK
jgi:pyruvate ferredoxin oxidoreductase alpha subunit